MRAQGSICARGFTGSCELVGFHGNGCLVDAQCVLCLNECLNERRNERLNACLNE